MEWNWNTIVDHTDQTLERVDVHGGYILRATTYHIGTTTGHYKRGFASSVSLAFVPVPVSKTGFVGWLARFFGTKPNDKI